MKTPPDTPSLQSTEEMRQALRAVGATASQAAGTRGQIFTYRGQSVYVPDGIRLVGTGLQRVRKEVLKVLQATEPAPSVKAPKDWTPMDFFDPAKVETATWEDIEKIMASGIMATRYVLIDQELANRIISHHNTHNRDLRHSKIAQYATDIRLGRWGISHQGIAFDVKGILVDGQHRLWAIDEAATPIWCQVTVNVPPGTQEYVDQGLPRKAIDVIRLAGDTEASVFQMAIARRMLIGVRASVITSRQEQIDFFRIHREAIVFASDQVFQKRRAFYVVQASVAAVVARAWYHADRDRLKRFGEVMLEGLSLGEGERPIILLREWLRAGSPREKSAQRLAKDLMIYMKTQRALVAFLGEEVLKTLYVMKEEAYPLPEEATARRSRTRLVIGPGRPPVAP